MVTRRHPTLTRYAAPIAFLAAVTVAVLIVREGLSEGSSGTAPRVTAVDTVETSPVTTRRAGRQPRDYEIRAGDTLETVAAKF